MIYIRDTQTYPTLFDPVNICYIKGVFKLYTGCIQVGFKLYPSYVQVVFKLHSSCIQVTFKLYSSYIQVVFKLHSCCIQAHTYMQKYTRTPHKHTPVDDHEAWILQRNCKFYTHTLQVLMKPLPNAECTVTVNCRSSLFWNWKTTIKLAMNCSRHQIKTTSTTTQIEA